MKDVTLAVMTRLLADTTITDVVSTRVYRRRLPQSTVFPSITVTRIDAIRDRDTNTGRYATARLQCSVFDTIAGRCEDISEMIADNLHRKIDTYGSGVYIVSVKDAGDITDENTDMNPAVFINHRDFMVEYAYT